MVSIHDYPANGADLALVANVVLTERQARDRGWWSLMGDQYWPDSRVRLSWYDGPGEGFVTGSRAMAQRGTVTLHHAFAPVIHVRSDRAYAEMSVAVRLQIDVDGVAADLVSATRLNYRLERRDDRWRITLLDAAYEYATLTPSTPGQAIIISPEELAHYRPSYALLAWSIAREGRTASHDLLGDDRPQELAAFYEDTWAWLSDELPA